MFSFMAELNKGKVNSIDRLTQQITETWIKLFIEGYLMVNCILCHLYPVYFFINL